MVVCICNNVSEEKIKELIATHNIKTIKGLQEHISICNNCGSCYYMIHDLLAE